MRRSRLHYRVGKRALFKKKAKKYILVALVLLMVLSFCWMFNNNIRPLLMAMCEVKARVIATQAINEAVSTELTYKIRYDDLFIVKTNNDNRITMLQANTMVMNSIATETALNIQERLRTIGTRKVSIPLGSMLGSEIFANYGPRLNVEIVPVGTVAVDFATDFEQAGINQTRHKIYLIVKTQVQIIVPLVSNRVEVTSRVPVAETIIVGDIPHNYIYLPENGILSITPNSLDD
ncbi:MAG: hypothetical protein HPY66_1451 [Firmicutes bacterium]|nr:hypothetical protein [Bacillota bacterium]MDI6706436.1 sporulation protein YunB [Bacillota bacterium]